MKPQGGNHLASMGIQMGGPEAPRPAECPWEAVAMRQGRPGPVPPRWPPYLFATLSDGGRELTDYHIHTLDTGLFELLHLLFHCGFKSEVRCEEARPAPGGEEEEEEEPQVGGWVRRR